ncbi:polyamine aminopropyltransferase [Actinacidiphila epipremni]|uniref:Polyamine aminopropyltransferase n=1 Tax=Actinacidiphila epipremni TaxID=2053013 RepID=A0ABX0ZZY3_9ACTN|nr:polyamine aminopropyltransferase [Actinacidiphila epipremni]NJP47158.1 polyamine aminopropyltransferase [Actinacidiphila epipremni]
MIDQRHRSEAPGRPGPSLAARLPVAAGAARALVLAAVFVCAACGLVYELELVALASYLVGDSVTQASVILSVMVFAMGCGSLLAKRLRGRAAVAFAAIETGLALVGGLSVMVLYAVFAWWGQATAAMVGCAFAIGVLTGAEVPLLMVLVQRVRRQDAGGAVADLFAADYVGALVGGLAFPFLLLPHAGQLTGALVTGVVNAAAGGATVLWLFRGDLSRRARGWLLLANVLVLAVLAGAAAAAGPFERAARRAVYGGDVRVAEQSDVEDIVLTGGDTPGHPLRLYLDGRLRVAGPATVRSARALVRPALAGPHARVLLLGGGDGLTLREVLRYGDVAAVTAVQPDAELLRLARTDPGLSRLNGHAYADPRVRTVTADPFDWLRYGRHATYDVVLADLPDPGLTRSAKLYSQEFFGLAARALAPGGRLAVPGGAMAGQARTFWTIDATVRAAGLRTTPYGAGAGGGGRGYVLAARGSAPRLGGEAGGAGARGGAAGLAAGELREVARPARAFPPSTLLRPRVPAP